MRGKGVEAEEGLEKETGQFPSTLETSFYRTAPLVSLQGCEPLLSDALVLKINITFDFKINIWNYLVEVIYSTIFLLRYE